MFNYRQEYINCFNDKTRIYFIENYLSTFNAMERKEVPFKLFPRQKEYLKSCAKNSNTIAIKHRQSGVSTISAAFIAGQCVFAKKNSPETALCIANKLDQAIELSNKIIGFLDQVPRWMWGPDFFSPDPDSEKNKKSIYVKRNKGYIELFNGCKIYARASTPHAARGISAVSILIFDEAAYIENSMASYTAAVAAQSTVADAKCLMVSTPNGKDQLYYKTYTQAIKGENNFNAVEFKWYQDPRYNRNLKWYKKNEKTGEMEWDVDTVIDKKGNIPYNEERWRDLEKRGWTPVSPWFTNMCKTMNNDEQKIAQELLVSFLGSADNVVPIDTIEQQRDENVIKITEDWPLKDTLIKETWIWKDPDPTHRYICACMPKGEKILTTNGFKQVEDVMLSDCLYDKEGKITPIKKIYERYTNETIYNIKPFGIGKRITFTGNHPIWASSDSTLKRCYSKYDKNYNFNERYYEHNFKFIKCKDLKAGGWLQIPNIYINKELSNEEILSHWHYDKVKNPLLNDKFWWLCGMWLAEGCCVKSKNANYRIYTSHNTNETDIILKVKKCIIELFERKPNSRIVNSSSNATNVFFNFNYLAKFLNNNFGKYAYGKYISEWIKYLPSKFKINLILGYLEGDGSFSVRKRDGLRITAGSVSLKLLSDLQDMLFSLGILSTVQLSASEKEMTIAGRKVNCRKFYSISIGKYDSFEFLKLCNLAHLFEDDRKIGHHRKDYMYFSNDKKYIFIKINEIIKQDYQGNVYNFETECHNYYVDKVCVHNCDPSSGSGEDATSIEIIDVDAVDENGIPCFEQVLEYNGKINGEDIAELIERYGRVYNDALAVVECIGGYGDAVVLKLLSIGYPNLYYDETTALKNYTNDYAKKLFNKKDDEKLPGFRSNALRIQMISNFVEMLKNNAFRVRSERVISELDTWIFKNGRPDHMDGAHDDNLTCLSMGLFVMQFYMLKTEKMKQKDSSIVKSWFVNNSLNTDLSTKHLRNSVNIASSKEMAKKYSPFGNSQRNDDKNMINACIMLGGFKIKK